MGSHKIKVGSDDSGYPVRLKLRHFFKYCRDHYDDDSPLYVFESRFAERKASRHMANDFQVPMQPVICVWLVTSVVCRCLKYLVRISFPSVARACDHRDCTHTARPLAESLVLQLSLVCYGPSAIWEQCAHRSAGYK